MGHHNLAKQISCWSLMNMAWFQLLKLGEHGTLGVWFKASCSAHPCWDKRVVDDALTNLAQPCAKACRVTFRLHIIFCCKVSQPLKPGTLAKGCTTSKERPHCRHTEQGHHAETPEVQKQASLRDDLSLGGETVMPISLCKKCPKPAPGIQY